MSEATELLSSMFLRGIRLWVESGQLRYRATRGALSPAEIETIREMKKEILHVLAQRQVFTPGAPRPATQMPLTFQQEAYWDFFCSNDPTWNHFIPSVLHLRGPLDIGALRRAVDKVTERHESLRMRLPCVEGRLIQAIDEPTQNKLLITNVGSKGGSDINDRARQFLEGFLRTRVDPAVGPLFEAHLLILDECDYLLAVAVHHVLSDAMSVSLLFQELWVLYGDFRRGRPCSLPDVPMQYSDYSSWQRNTWPHWLETHGGYWRAKLAGASRLRFPIERGLPGARSFSSQIIRVTFNETLSSGLRDLARSEKTSLALVILGVFSAVSSAWCNQRDFVIPFNITGRSSPEHVNIVGLLFHSLLLRIALTGNETFTDLLRLVSQEFFTAHPHLDYGTLTRDFRHLYTGAILQCLSLQPDEVEGVATPPDAEDLKDHLAIESFPIELVVLPETSHMNAEIQVGFQDTPQGICAGARYRADLFATDTMETFFGDLTRFSEYVVANPRSAIARFW